jgi:hypothetical protein
MNIHIPVGSIMWAKTPGTDNYMPYRMRTLIQFWKVVNGQKTELLTARYSGDGGVFGANNHPSGSALDVPLGQYCYVVYNISENQVPINMLILRGDSANTNSIWGCASDINGSACYQKVEAGEKKEIYFNVENYEGSLYYHLDCNAWFVTAEQNFSSTAIDTVTNYGLNPLRITLQEGVTYFYNTIRENPYIIYLANSEYFEGTTTLNPFYVAITPATTSGTASGTVINGTIQTPQKTPTNKNLIIGAIALFGFFIIKKRKDGDNN